MFDIEETTKELFKIVENLKFKGYTFLKERAGNNKNFFVWKKTDRKEYLRITLLSNREPRQETELLFYWCLEFSFKPFCYNHNHKAGAKWYSEPFNSKAEDLYLSRFFEAIKQIKLYSDRVKK